MRTMSTAQARSAWKRAEHGSDPRCTYCGNVTSLHPDAGWLMATVDHVVPLARGGREKVENYALACRACNEAKGSAKSVTQIKRRKFLASRKVRA